MAPSGSIQGSGGVSFWVQSIGYTRSSPDPSRPGSDRGVIVRTEYRNTPRHTGPFQDGPLGVDSGLKGDSNS